MVRQVRRGSAWSGEMGQLGYDTTRWCLHGPGAFRLGSLVRVRLALVGYGMVRAVSLGPVRLGSSVTFVWGSSVRSLLLWTTCWGKAVEFGRYQLRPVVVWPILACSGAPVLLELGWFALVQSSCRMLLLGPLWFGSLRQFCLATVSLSMSLSALSESASLVKSGPFSPSLFC